MQNKRDLSLYKINVCKKEILICLISLIPRCTSNFPLIYKGVRNKKESSIKLTEYKCVKSNFIQQMKISKEEKIRDTKIL